MVTTTRYMTTTTTMVATTLQPRYMTTTTTIVVTPTCKPSVSSDDIRCRITLTSGITLIILQGAIIFVTVIA